jgi:hypothetical protein
LSAVNPRPSNVNSTVITLPVLNGDFGPKSGYRVTRVIFELGKTDV